MAVAEYGWRFEAVTPIGEVTAVYPAAAGNLSYDASRDVSKTLGGMVFLPNEMRKFSPVADEIKVYLILNGVEYPMGYFTASEAPEQRDVLLDPETNLVSNLYNVGFGDRMARLIRSNGSPQTLPAGFDPAQEAIQLLAFLGIPYAWDGSASVAGNSISWNGDVTVLSKIVQLSELAGHRNPWMNNEGIIRSELATTPFVLDPDILSVYDLNVEANSLVVTPLYLTAPNVVIVSGNTSSGNAPVTGRWDAPSAAPHSFANRGYFYTQMEERQGLLDSAHAEQVAKAIGEKNSARILNFRCEPNPKLLDGPTILSYDGTLWVVTSSSTDLSANGLSDIQAEELPAYADDTVPGEFL